MKKLLVIRNDKIGDFMVCFPAFAMLKQSMPNVEITALVPSYTAPLAELCPSIDKIIIDTANKKDKNEFNRILQAVKMSNLMRLFVLFQTGIMPNSPGKVGLNTASLQQLNYSIFI
ncbi:lipopolysaccharide heptosyltransferase II [Mannheimia haemolytica]|uniref:Lipopolysaccharide heptosyltransferase II n=1 Tax=Mannheimia haemolytica TaxID=75985 RepID=A0A378MYJ9_MANHA|nr:lipopolysaccharide heptosyltransferase II [Mannheimia haemolytica]